MMKPEAIFPANDILGEGPVWNKQEQTLYWVDIIKKKLQRWHPRKGDYKSWTLPGEIGCFALREKKNSAVVALRSGLHFLDLKADHLDAIVDPEEHLETNRFNDGKCDRKGRFWAGTMAEDGNATGALYLLDQALTCMKKRSKVGISNGLGWSPDNKVMYHTDSSAQTIFAFNYDLETARMSNERVFARLDDGFPDGLTVDAEGYIWSAIWDGWRINRYAPDGDLVDEVKMPVARPTSCMFGGQELNELFVTSARVGLSEKDLTRQPHAGDVFSIKTNVKGILEPYFTG